MRAPINTFYNYLSNKFLIELYGSISIMIVKITNLEKHKSFIASFMDDNNFSDPMLTTSEQIEKT